MRSAPLRIHAVPYDLPAARAMVEDVQAYYRSIYDGPDPSPTDPAEFTPPYGCFFLGDDDTDQPVAMGGWRFVEPMEAWGARRPVEIKRMYVASWARGRGYARQMLAHLEATAADAQADAVVLSTGPVQTDAIALYRSSGYDDIPGFGFFAAYPNAVHLGKRLGVEPAKVSAPRAGETAR